MLLLESSVEVNSRNYYGQVFKDHQFFLKIQMNVQSDTETIDKIKQKIIMKK